MSSTEYLQDWTAEVAEDRVDHFWWVVNVYRNGKLWQDYYYTSKIEAEEHLSELLDEFRRTGP